MGANSGSGGSASTPGTVRFPHSGGPPPASPWWAGISQKWSATTADVQKNWAATSKRWYKNGKLQMPVDVQGGAGILYLSE